MMMFVRGGVDGWIACRLREATAHRALDRLGLESFSKADDIICQDCVIGDGRLIGYRLLRSVN